MASVFSSLNLSIIFGNRKMFFLVKSRRLYLTGPVQEGNTTQEVQSFLWTSGGIKVQHADNAKHQTEEAKQILQWRKEGTGAGNSANEERPRLTEWENPSSGHQFLSSLRCSAGKQIAETCWGATVELPGVVKPSASVVAIIQQFPQLPSWEAALLSLWFKNLE